MTAERGVQVQVRRQLATAAAGQAALLAALTLGAGLGAAGLLAGVAYITTVCALLVRAVRRADPTPEGWVPGDGGLGPANLVTLTRSVLIGGVAALVVDRFAAGSSHVGLLVVVASVALLLDAVDGQVARRTRTVSALGARFDMESDAYLILVLSLYVAPIVGPVTLAIGGMRYAFVAVGGALPWLRAPLPTRYSAKVVAAIQGIALVIVATGLLPPPSATGLVAVALGLLLWSFGHDVLWLWRRRGGAAHPVLIDRPEAQVALGPEPVLSSRRGSVVLTALAAVLVLGALLLPSRPDALGPAMLHLPLEAVLGAALLLVLPVRTGLVLATVAGAVLGLLTVLTVLDFGFLAVLSRPFDPTADWHLAGSVIDLLTGSLGRTGAVAALTGFLALVAALLVVVTLAARRVATVVVRRPTLSRTVLAVLVPVCAVSLALGAGLVPGAPVTAANATSQAVERGRRLIAAPGEQRAFEASCASDPLRGIARDQLLAGLRGKDVVIAFVESYGRSALTASDYAGPMSATLDDATRRLTAAGFGTRSAYLTSPTSGGGSWLAHATFLSGLWVDSERRHSTLMASDRMTVVGAFRRAGWRTAAVMPGNTEDWPESKFYGFDRVHDSRSFGYRGPDLGWASIPDQYSLSVLERTEHGRKARPPLFTEIALVSSHAPWPIIPEVIDWDRIGDGAVYDSMTTGEPRDAIWAKGTTAVRSAYRRSLQYSLDSVVTWLETYGGKDTVVVLLGDHQGAPLLTEPGAGRDVPVTLIAGDPAVLDQVADWAWTPGMAPAPDAPVWRMDAFRDRFLTTFSAGT
jgi:phosphatidylglycerophosphate synthase